MAASKKKVVTKDDLRRFMKEKQSLSKATSKRVDHPLAKYNSLNQLVCVLCNNVIKNDLLWPAHIQSKQHKEKVLAVKTQGPAKPEHLTNTQAKRKGNDESQTVDSKKRKIDTNSNNKGLPTDFFDNDPKPSRDEIRERAKAALLAGYSSSSEESEDEDKDTSQNTTNNKPDSSSSTQPSTSSSSKSGLPADFFDPGNEPSSSDEAKPEPAHSKKMSEILPEGFFDDPKMDAKVRKVEYKDKEEEEWELFQKAIKEEAQVSEVIMEEEDEQVNIDRNIDEIDDQIQRWQEVENLHVKKDAILKCSKTDKPNNDDSGDEMDGEQLDEFLDWRAKKSLK